MLKIKEEIFKYYFYFMQERMKIFWEKYYGIPGPPNRDRDEILRIYKFTNVYRASDRVSQYLIKNVIYKINDKSLNEIDVLLRILVFKIFNKVETWEYLENAVGIINVNNFDLKQINKVLAERRKENPIFSNAYMMTGTHSRYNYLSYKHEKWLYMLQQELLIGKVFQKILSAKSLSEVYGFLRNCSFIGDFLAYQYAIDLNYSPFINFSEDSFVKAGIGSIRGIKKCFKSLGNGTFEDAIRFTQDNLERLRERFGFLEFKDLFGRKPTLIDIQNCFCETDKYLRARVPELQIDNVRIKQKYKETNKTIEYFFPPKWGINSELRTSINVC